MQYAKRLGIGARIALVVGAVAGVRLAEDTAMGQQLVVTSGSVTGSGGATAESNSDPVSINFTGFPTGGSDAASVQGFASNGHQISRANASVVGTLSSSSGIFSGFGGVSAGAASTSTTIGNQIVWGSGSGGGNTHTRVEFRFTQAGVLYQGNSSRSAWTAGVLLQGPSGSTRQASCGCDVRVSGPGGVLVQRSFAASTPGNVSVYWPPIGSVVRIDANTTYAIDIECSAAVSAGRGGTADTSSHGFGFAFEVRSAACPTFTVHPSSASTGPGGSVSWTVGVAGAAPFTYVWRKNGSTLTNVPGRVFGANSATLTVTTAGASDEGVYECVVSNAFGMATSNPAALTVCVADTDDGSGGGTPDGGVTIDDLLYYLLSFEVGAPGADVDDGSGTGTPDGGVTIDDLLYYLQRFEAGC